MTLVAPGVPATDVVTAPFESSVSAWPAASSWPPSTIFLKVARVPDDAGRMIRTIAWSGPPTSFQFVVLPVQMSVACWVVRLVTPVTLGLLTMIQPCLAMMWSTSWEASSGLSLSSALTSLSPMFTAPWRTCVSPVPDPPPWTLTVEPAQAAAYCFPAAWEVWARPGAGPAAGAAGGGAGAGPRVLLPRRVDDGLERSRSGGGRRAGHARGRRHAARRGHRRRRAGRGPGGQSRRRASPGAARGNHQSRGNDERSDPLRAREHAHSSWLGAADCCAPRPSPSTWRSVGLVREPVVVAGLRRR